MQIYVCLFMHICIRNDKWKIHSACVDSLCLRTKLTNTEIEREIERDGNKPQGIVSYHFFFKKRQFVKSKITACKGSI